MSKIFIFTTWVCLLFLAISEQQSLPYERSPMSSCLAVPTRTKKNQQEPTEPTRTITNPTRNKNNNKKQEEQKNKNNQDKAKPVPESKRNTFVRNCCL